MRPPKKLYENEREAFYEIAGRCWDGNPTTRDRADYQAIRIMTESGQFRRLTSSDLLLLVGSLLTPEQRGAIL